MIDNEARNIIAMAFFKAEAKASPVEIELTNTLHGPRIPISLTMNNRAVAFTKSLEIEHGTVNIKLLKTLYGYASLIIDNEYFKTYSYNPHVHVRKDCSKGAAVLNSKNSTVMIVGDEDSGKQSIVDGVLLYIDHNKLHRLHHHQCIKIDEMAISMISDFSPKTEGILTILQKFLSEYNNILLLDYRGIINLEDKINTQRQSKIIFSILMKIPGPKIICCSKQHQGLFKNSLDCDYIATIESEKFINPSDRQIIISEILHRDTIFNHDNTTKYLIDNKYYNVANFNSKIVNSTITISDLVSCIKSSYSESTMDNPIRVISIEKGMLNKYAEHNEFETNLELSDRFTNRIRTLGKYLDNYIIGQDECKASIIASLKKNIVVRGDRPLTSIILAGPTGVGKTETAKRIANHIFGNCNDSLLRLDMGEFEEGHTGSSILGAPSGYLGHGDKTIFGEFLDRRGDEGGVILFDEFEKAHTNVQDILLGIMDYGTVKTRWNQEYDLRNYIIMTTTNADTSKRIMGLGNSGVFQSKDKLSETFRKELLGRFDVIGLYNSLSIENLQEIAHLKLKRLAESLLKNKEIKIKWRRNIKRGIVNLINHPNGREIDYYVRNHVISTISEFIDTNPKCKNITITMHKNEVVVQPTTQ